MSGSGQRPANGDPVEDAIKLYGQVLRIIEPVRLQYWGELGLTLPQLRMLGTLAQQPGLSVRDLAAALRVTPSTVSQQVDRLVRLGLVDRREDEQDRRLLHHALTEKGGLALEQIQRAARRRLRDVLSHLTPEELRAVCDSFSLLCAAADATAADGEEAAV